MDWCAAGVNTPTLALIRLLHESQLKRLAASVTTSRLACRVLVYRAVLTVFDVVCRRQHILPRLASLDPALANEAMLRVVGRLPVLAALDAGITEVLRALPFVPTAAGNRKAPSELHDPR